MSTFVIPSVFTAIDKITAPIRKIIRVVQSFGASAESAGARASRALRSVGNGADRAFKALNPLSKINNTLSLVGIGLSISGLTSLIGKFVKEASNVENAEASFTALLGSVENAKKMVKELYALGASTPFEFSDLSSAANLMIGFGAATQKNVIDKLKMLGDVAMGDKEKLGGIALAYSQIIAGGKANMQDINQLINNGVPILGQLAKQWHVTAGAARDAVSKGKATAGEIDKAFQAMTSSGGMFFNGMSIASKTLSGMISTLKDTVNQTFASIGAVALPIIKEYVDKATAAAEKIQIWAKDNEGLIKQKVVEWVDKIVRAVNWLKENFDKIVLALKIYIAVLLVLKTTTILVTLVTNGMAIATGIATTAKKIATAATWLYEFSLGALAVITGTVTGATLASTAATYGVMAAVKVATAATWLWNAALNANPIGLIIIAIAALIGLIVVVIKHWDSWGAAVTFFMGPLGMVISLFKTLYDDWELIKKAFKTNGITGALKAIGRSILDSILSPLQQVLEIAAKLPGIGDWAQRGADNIKKFRDGMYGHDNNQESNGSVRVDPNNGMLGLLNPKLIKMQSEQTINNNNNSNQQVSIDINDKSGRAKVKRNTGGVPIVLTKTTGQF